MDDAPVLVVDLRERARADDRAALGGAPPPLPADEPLEAHERVDTVAVLHDGSDEPLLLAIEPTRDRGELDAIARILRFAVLHGARMPEVAVTHGGEQERSMAFERRLPRWAYEGIDRRRARALPPALRAVLAPRG